MYCQTLIPANLAAIHAGTKLDAGSPAVRVLSLSCSAVQSASVYRKRARPAKPEESSGSALAVGSMYAFRSR